MNQLLEIIASDPQIENIVVMFDINSLAMLDNDDDRQMMVKMVAEILKTELKKNEKPIYVLIFKSRQNHERTDKFQRIVLDTLIDEQVPWVSGSFRNVAMVFSKLAQYKKRRALPKS